MRNEFLKGRFKKYREKSLMEKSGANQAPPHQKMYFDYRESIDKVVDTAFEVVQWYGLENNYLSKQSGQTIVIPLNLNWNVVVVFGIEERPNAKNLKFPPEHTCHQFDYLWKVIAYFLHTKTGKVKQQGMFTRKDKIILQNVMRMMFYPVGNPSTPPSRTFMNGLMIGYKLTGEEDVPVIEAAKIELVKEYEASQNPVEVCGKCAGEKVTRHIPSCPKRSKPRKKKDDQVKRTDTKV